MRGKALNSWEVKRELLFSNAEIHDIAVAIGVDPHGAGAEPDLSGLRYGKIASMTDADVDGAHISVLLLTLFYRHFPKLIERGHIWDQLLLAGRAGHDGQCGHVCVVGGQVGGR